MRRLKKIHRMFVLVEFNNSGPHVQLFTSKKKIDFQQIVDYYVTHEDFNEERDSLTVVDDPNTPAINLDKK